MLALHDVPYLIHIYLYFMVVLYYVLYLIYGYVMVVSDSLI